MPNPTKILGVILVACILASLIMMIVFKQAGGLPLIAGYVNPQPPEPPAPVSFTDLSMLDFTNQYQIEPIVPRQIPQTVVTPLAVTPQNSLQTLINPPVTAPQNSLMPALLSLFALFGLLGTVFFGPGLSSALRKRGDSALPNARR